MMGSPTRLALAGLTILITASAAQSFEDAGASTFHSAGKLYHREIPRLEDIPVPHVEVRPQEGAAEKPGAASGPSFVIQRFEVRGNTLLPIAQIHDVLTPFRGAGRTIRDVQAARDTLQKVYAKEGFLSVAVSIPQQTVTAGTIQLQVIEARLGKVAIDNPGVHWYSNAVISDRTPHLRPGAILRRKDVEEDLRRVNATRDLRVRPVLKPGAEPQTVDLTLDVEDRIPLHVSVEADNDHPPGAPANRAQGQISYSNLWDRGHEASLFYQTALSSDPTAVAISGATYRAPMPWDENQSLFYYIVNSDTQNQVVTAPGVTLFGKGFNMGLRYQVVLPWFEGMPWYHHSLTFGIDHKDVENDLQSTAQKHATPIKYMPLSLAYDVGLNLTQSQTVFHMALGLNRAGWVPGGSKEDFQANRGGTSPPIPSVDGDYEVLRFVLNESVRAPAFLKTLAAGRFITLPEPASPYFSDDWTFHLVTRGQWASQPLIPTEQFSAGGVDTVRGYLQSERFGDDAWNTRLELRTPNWTPPFLHGPLTSRFQLLGFFDAAGLYTQAAGEGQRPYQDLRGIGVGLTANLSDRLTALLYASHPLVTTEYTDKDVGFNFQVSAGF